MGIYDREYYRREGPSFLKTFANRGQVCLWLVIINVVAFFLQALSRQYSGDQFTKLFLLDADKVFTGQVWRLLTYAFLHDVDGILHIVFNMLFLWWFGKEIEDLYGRWEFLAFYLVSAVLGGITFTLAYKLGFGDSPYCIGASGAVTAVLVVFAFHYPRHIILVMFVIPMPVWLVVVLMVAADTLGFLSGNAGGVAVTVHLAGAGFGAIYYQTRLRLLDLVPKFRLKQKLRARPKLRIYQGEEEETPVPVAAGPGPNLDEQLEAKLDEVLAKVAHSGQASLTDHEKQILLRASEIYKKKRH